MKRNARYSRQQLFLGSKSQARLEKAKACIIGCGALGSKTAELLSRAGVSLILADRDFVEPENLSTQQFAKADVGLPKTVALKNALLKSKTHAKITAVVDDVNKTNIEKIINGCSIVIDGTDNSQTRLLINDACTKHSVPWVFGTCVKAQGMTASFVPSGPCFRCAFQAQPSAVETCDTAGLFPPAASLIAALQASEAMKILAGLKPTKELLFVDTLEPSVEKIRITKNPACPCCAKHEYEFLKTKSRETTVLCGKNAVQVAPSRGFDKLALLARLEKARIKSSANAFMLNFKAKGLEVIVFDDGRAIIKGTADQKIAKTIYAQYVGL